MKRNRTVITGLGAISPLGLTHDQMWEALCRGDCGIGPITAFDPTGFPCKLAGQVPAYRIQQYVPKTYRKAAKLFCRDIELAIMAAGDAFCNAGIKTRATASENPDIDPVRTAVNVGAGLISCDLEEIAPAVARGISDEGSFDMRRWAREGFELITPLWLLKYLPNMLACHIGIIHDIQGPSNTIMCAEVAGHIAITEASQIIARGAADVAIAGGAEAKVNPIVMMRQYLAKRAVGGCKDPATACRPFDHGASGSVFGEGAAMVVLESTDHAAERGAAVYAEIAGCGHSACLNTDRARMEGDGEGLKVAIEKAIDQAGITAEQLDLIVPHGTGIPADDLAECRGLEAALGRSASRVPAWPTKSMLSNTGAAAGALDVVAAACAIKHAHIPAAVNCENKAEGCNLNIVTRPQDKTINYALCCGYTYGGQTAAIVLKKTSR